MLVQLDESQTAYEAHAPQMQAEGPDFDELGPSLCAGGRCRTWTYDFSRV